MNVEALRRAFQSAHCGYSADRVVADPDLNGNFLAECARHGVSESPERINHALLNLRKSGDLRVVTTRETRLGDDDDYRFAAEHAIRFLERTRAVTLDDVLCDPQLGMEFDRIASLFAPGYSPLEYRWSALSLRKERALVPETTTRILRPENGEVVRVAELDAATIPSQQGVYVFVDAGTGDCLYIGEARDLRKRLAKHLEHSDNPELARYIWDNGIGDVVVEIYVLPSDTDSRARRAVELEQIRKRKPKFNVLGLE